MPGYSDFPDSLFIRHLLSAFHMPRLYQWLVTEIRDRAHRLVKDGYENIYI